MKFLCSEKISAHKYKTPEGYLVCVDSVLARTGKQTYKRSEIFGCDCKDAENEVDVDRPAEEVFSDKTLASFENKPLTIEHPDEDVNTSNHRDLAVGFARDIKRGKDNGQDVMLGTLVFTDEDAIEAIENGEMVELSCGYDADIVDEDNPCQRNIRGNHIALCQRGRAGNARIVDSKVKDAEYHQIDMTDPWGGTRSLIVRAYSFEEAKKKAEQFKPEWKFRAAWEASKDDVDSAKRRGLYVDSKVRDDSLQKGKTYVATSGATLKVVDYECSFSDYNGEASVIITYDYVSASGKKSGRAKANAHDFWKMLTDKSLTGDSLKDDKLSDLKVVLRSISSMQRRDLDIEDVMRTLRNAGFKSSVEKIEGWKENQNVPGEQIKNYTLNIEGLNKRALVTFYADMGKWTTKEINAYVVDSVKDNLELPEDEDSTFMYRDAYGKEIIVTNWDGRNTFLIEYDGTEQQMTRKDVEYYLDRKGARFSRVLRDSVKDADFSKQSKQGYQVIEMYRDAGRLHAILKRSNDYVIAYGYDTSDGTWAQGRYDFSTLEKAREALQEEKKYAKRIADVDTSKEVNENLKAQARKEMKDDYSGIYQGYTYSFNSKRNLWTITTPSENVFFLHGDADPKAYIAKLIKSMRDSKEDILAKIRSTQIREGDTFEMRDGQYLVQIQNVGKQTIEFKGNNWRVGHASIKESSWAWGRIWKNGTIVFNETDALNIVRDKMIQFLKTVRDSKRR